jgi:hypothetical protein
MTILFNTSFKAALATGALAVASLGMSGTALADVDTGANAAGNGGVVLAVWDGTHSVLQYLGANFNDFSGGGPASSTYNVNLSSLTGFDPSMTSYMVFSPKDNGSGPFSKGLLATITDYQIVTDAYPPGGDVGAFGAGNTEVSSNVAAQSIQSAINVACSGTPVCLGTAGQSSYFDSNSLGGGIDYSGNISTALQFFKFLNADNSQTTVNTQIGSFSLTAGTGDLANAVLSYTSGTGGGDPAPVPLPAALWLLVSGLTGFGVIGRRKNAVATDAVAA